MERIRIGELGTVVELGDEANPTGGLGEEDAGRPMVDVQLDSGKVIPFYLDEVEPVEVKMHGR